MRRSSLDDDEFNELEIKLNTLKNIVEYYNVNNKYTVDNFIYYFVFWICGYIYTYVSSDNSLESLITSVIKDYLNLDYKKIKKILHNSDIFDNYRKLHHRIYKIISLGENYYKYPEILFEGGNVKNVYNTSIIKKILIILLIVVLIVLFVIQKYKNNTLK